MSEFIKRGRGRHAAAPSPDRRRWLALAVVALAAAAAVVATIAVTRPSASPDSRHGLAAPSGSSASTSTATCPQQLTVVTARSYAPVLTRVAAGLHSGSGCVGVKVSVADGQGAAAVVASSGADVWIADDASWPQLPSSAKLATGQALVIATSPVYIVTQHDASLPATARSWLGLARLLAGQPPSWRLRVVDPAASGDGMVGAGALADAVLDADGPLVSALDLMRVWQAGTTAANVAGALPTAPTQVAAVPEYALVHAARGTFTAYAPTDGTALLRYSWQPTASGTADPSRAAALSRLRQALTGTAGAAALAAAGLRGPTWPAAAPPAAGTAGLPRLSAPATPTLSEHFMYHVLSTYHPDLRRANMLVVVDVSGSMAEPVAAGAPAKMDLVRKGLAQVAGLLPDNATLGVWRFGSLLAPPNDWQPLVTPAQLGSTQRSAIHTASTTLAAVRTGTGLYDTILAAYRYQQAHYVTGEPNEILVFTDGVNEDDPVSIDLAQLQAGLAASSPGKRVQLAVFGFGSTFPTTALNAALKPVGGQVDPLTTPDQVTGAFVHAVSGALSGVPG
jgi:Bacterial extracellular solute-binding protein/von Willebrand factor type A domain